MTNKEGSHLGPIVLAVCVLSFLIFWFGRYIQTGSFDLAQHYLLVNEIMKHAEVGPDAFHRIGSMAMYPAAAHWMAAVIGWIGGSGLVGITIITIAAVYLCYLLITYLIGASAPANVLLFAIAFLGLMFTRSQIGWEVVANYFYPQLVADVVYFGVLLWVSRNREDWKQLLAFLAAGLLTMWIHALVAVHILAAGCVLMAFQLWNRWSKKSVHRATAALCVMALLVGSVVIVLTNPAFKAMREISANDGYLAFGYSNFMLVALLCAALGAWNLNRHWRARGEYVDAVLGAAVIAAVCLAFLQFALLKLHGDGSAYAVKKHMFIIVTLGVVNVVRALASYLPTSSRRLKPGLVAPILAGFASFFVLKGFDTPVAPIVSALAYANNAVDYQLADFTPGNTVADDSSLPVMGNVMISLGAFQHPFDARAISWQSGASIRDGSPYVMVRRTESIDKICSQRFAEAQNYVIVDPACLRNYRLNAQLNFNAGGNGWNYASTGWGGGEAWGSWTLGDGGVLNLSLAEPVKGPLELSVDGMVFVTGKHPVQRIDIVVNGVDIGTWTYLREAPSGKRSIEIPESIARPGKLRIVFKGLDAVSPLQLGESPDSRVLGLGIRTVTLSDAVH